MTILALSGLRVEELARMKAGDLRLKGPIQFIALRGTKTEAAAREVPIHPDALPIITRRAEGKAPDAYLLDELPTPAADSAMERGSRSRRRSGGSDSASGLTAGRRRAPS